MITATIFGGTGFLGRRIVDCLRDKGYAVRVAVRHPARVPRCADRDDTEFVRCDIRDDQDVVTALQGADVAVNAVALYTGSEGDFAAIHVEGARRVATHAAAAGVNRLIHVSGIGVDPCAADAYIRSRARGEQVVHAAFDKAVVVRPSVIVAADDPLLNRLAGLVNWSPALPLFGHGRTRLQLVLVDDVAAAITALCLRRHVRPVYELGGPEALTYAALLQRIAQSLSRHYIAVPLPFALWEFAARVASVLPFSPLTPAQVAVMRDDNLVDPTLPGFAELDIVPQSIDGVIAEIAATMRR